jgi:ATP-dependent RNA helicase DDX46/PRP5
VLDCPCVDFLVKVREGKAKAAGSGFGGKGLDKFEAERESKDRAERAFYGEDGARVEKGSAAAAISADANKDKGKEGATATPDHGFDFKVEIVKGAAPDKIAPAVSTSKPTPAATMLGSDTTKLPAQTVAALQRAQAAGVGDSVKENLQQIAARIEASLNKTKAEKNAATMASQPAKSSDATEYHAIVPINDYPQKARWKATNKEQMVQLQELSGASITNKGKISRGRRVIGLAGERKLIPLTIIRLGIFYETGKEPGPGQEPKLHLLIESNEEFRVKLAVDELRRILLDASVAALVRLTGAQAGANNVFFFFAHITCFCLCFRIRIYRMTRGLHRREDTR